jgi:hypothetical protein
MAENQSSNNNQNAQSVQTGNQNTNSNAADSGWITVNTSDSVIVQRMNIMKGNDNQFSTKNGK